MAPGVVFNNDQINAFIRNVSIARLQPSAPPAMHVCSGNGNCDGITGQCICVAFRHGPGCGSTYTNANTCSGDGVVDGSGGCTCNADFAGSSCQFDTTAFCNGNGVFSIGSEDLPVCSCTAGVGDRCYSDAVTCTWTLPPVRHRVRHRHLPCYSIRLHYALCTMLRASTWGGV